MLESLPPELFRLIVRRAQEAGCVRVVDLLSDAEEAVRSVVAEVHVAESVCALRGVSSQTRAWTRACLGEMLFEAVATAASATSAEGEAMYCARMVYPTAKGA